MPQISTDLYHSGGLPGHFSVDPSETESILSPVLPQVFEITAGANPMTDGDYSLTLTIASSVVVTSAPFASAGLSDTDWATQFGAFLGTDAAIGSRFAVSVNANVITLTARSAALNATSPLVNQPAADAAIAQTQAPGGAPLIMGVFYKYLANAQQFGAVTNTPRQAWSVRSLELDDTIDLIRGVVGREVNSTTLDPLFNSAGQPDQYRPGQVAPGINREHVWALAETDFAVGDDVYVVLNPGLYSQVGAVANAADGANTLLISGPGNALARAVSQSQTAKMSGLSVRMVELKVNRTQ